MEDLTLEGRVDGPVLCEGYAVTVAESAQMTGDIVARDITVLGSFSGRLIATEVVDVRPSATVTGQISSVLRMDLTCTRRFCPCHTS